MARIIPSAQPFFFPGSETGCLLVHGFTGTPKEMRWMGEYLAEKGYTVLGIRLAGHATQPEDMIRTRWGDWYASVEDGWQLLQNHCKQVFVVGLSMGGALALLFAAEHPVAGVVAMSTPYRIPGNRRARLLVPFTRLISIFKPYMAKGPSTWFNPEAQKSHISYPANPVRSIYELSLLLKKMRGALLQVGVPVLLMHSRDEVYVLPENMEKIHEELGTEHKEKAWVEKSRHVITRDGDRKKVFEAAADFIQRVSRESH